MDTKYKILIIDDSALMRSIESDIINRDGRFEVIDTAVDGVTGLDLLIKNNGLYDLVILDVNMPKMNGLEVLIRIQRYKLKCKVIMVSTLVKEGARETILALERGAVDFVLKPTLTTSKDKRGDFEKKLIESISAVLECGENISVGSKKTISNLKETLGERVSQNVAEVINNKKFNNLVNGKKLVAIACSTGGPKTLKEIIPKIPKNLDAPIVLVQHMPSGFTKSLAERLNELSELSVMEAEDGLELKKGYVYIAPGGKQLRVISKSDNVSVFKITDEAPREGLRPCANIMYESLTNVCYDKILCVVLTGMGADGTAGIEKLSKSKETYVIAQNAATSVVYGMPRAIVSSGMADEVLALDDIADSIIKNVGVLNNGR